MMKSFNWSIGIAVAISTFFTACQSAHHQDGNRTTASGPAASMEQYFPTPQELKTLGNQTLADHLLALQGNKDLQKKKPFSLEVEISNYQQDPSEVSRILKKFEVLKRNPIIENKISVSSNEYRSSGVDRSQGPNKVRLTQWNIERGEEFEQVLSLSSQSVGPGQTCDRAKIKALFDDSIASLEGKSRDKADVIKRKRNFLIGFLAKITSPIKTKFEQIKDEHILRLMHELEPQFIDEVCALSESDILVLNEVDNGLCRSGYRDVAAEYAQNLKMNYAWVPEFIEAEPEKTGLQKDSDPHCKNQDDSKARNLTGNAILSRFPLSNVRSIPFNLGPKGKVDKETGEPTISDKGEQCWDWHDNEAAQITLWDKGLHKFGESVFGEPYVRELRYGNRNTLIADVTLPNGNIITVVNFHLENMATSNCRTLQLKNVLAQLKDNRYPLVVAGDLNTTNYNSGAHKTVPAFTAIVAGSTVMSSSFWISVLPIAAPFPGAGTTYEMIKKFAHWMRTDQNPTRKNIYYFSENQEGHVFDELKRNGFVWKGPNEQEASQFLLNTKFDGPWSSTNERDRHGFAATHWVHSPVKPTFGIMKLDWILLKEGEDRNACIIPRYPRTLESMRDILREKFPSDHLPISVMLESGPCGDISFLK